MISARSDGTRGRKPGSEMESCKGLKQGERLSRGIVDRVRRAGDCMFGGVQGRQTQSEGRGRVISPLDSLESSFVLQSRSYTTLHPFETTIH